MSKRNSVGVITDPIGDALIRIKNANQRKHKNVLIPFAKDKVQIFDILKAEGYILGYEIEGEEPNKKINLALKYNNDQRVIVGVKRVSKPGLRVHVRADKIPNVLSGYGTVIISTSQGVMTGKKAKKLNIGGEIIAYVW